jgi:hypothetical protein
MPGRLNAKGRLKLGEEEFTKFAFGFLQDGFLPQKECAAAPK